jgi:hypothetical protein
MGHDPTKVLLGTTQSSDRPGITTYQSDPATFLAGTACRVGSDGLLTFTKASNKWAGISLGKSLSDTAKTSILRCGSGVPVLLELAPARGNVTITSYANLLVTAGDVVTIGATAFTAQAGAVTPGGATFRAATSNAATAASLAAQINAHATAGALVYAVVDPTNSAKVLLTAFLNGTAGNSIILTYTDNGAEIGATVSGSGTLAGGAGTTDFVTIGANAYFSNTTGKADDASSDSTISDAIYVSGVLDGIDEAGNTVPVAIVDMIGGL